MQFLTPLGFLLAALAIPILLLYMLKLRRKQVQVSSIFLWVQLLRDQQANAPWQKLKRNLLLILQLLILAALTIAFARPAIRVPAVASGSVIVLLDGSASMNATDVSPSRFEEARKSVRALINGLSNDSAMTLILAADSPQTLISAETDQSVLRQALDKARVTQGRADWQAAFALAAGAARSNQGKATIVVVSDGGLPENGLPALPGEVRYIPIGESRDNLAISALALRPAQKGPQLFAEANNHTGADRNVLLSIYFNAELIDARQLNLRAGSSGSLTLAELSNTNGIYEARLSDPEQPLRRWMHSRSMTGHLLCTSPVPHGAFCWSPMGIFSSNSYWHPYPPSNRSGLCLRKTGPCKSPTTRSTFISSTVSSPRSCPMPISCL